MYYLVVRNPFGGHPKGATITDQATVTAILADPHRAACVVKISATDDGRVNTPALQQVSTDLTAS